MKKKITKPERKATIVYLTSSEVKMVEKLKERTGIRSMSGIVAFSIRELFNAGAVDTK